MTRVRLRDFGLALASFVTVGLLWEAAVAVFDLPSFLLPPPSAVIAEMIDRPELYARHTWVTLYEVVLGFLLAAVTGIGTAILLTSSRIAQALVYPLVVVLQIIPKVAIAPLLLIWVGFGIQSKVVLALLIAFFPVVVNTASGLRAADPEMLELVKVLQGRRWQELVKVRFPHALPYIFSGLKVAITLAVIGAVIGEFVGGNQGLGYLIIIANVELNLSMSFAALATLSITGLVLFGVVSLIERLVAPWGAVDLPSTGM